MRRIVFERWLTVSTRVRRTYRVAVWRVTRGRRAGIWSEAERAMMRGGVE